MTPFYLSEFFHIDGEHDHAHLSPFHTDHANSFPFPLLFDTLQDQDHHPQQPLQTPIDFMQIGGPSTDSTINSNTHILKQSLPDQYLKEEDSQGSGKWMSSKMRIMRKMMINSDQMTTSNQMTTTNQETKVQEKRARLNQDISSSSNSTNSTTTNNILGGDIIRTCSDCNTTKTPLWRSGPRGPKSLCNACGIRQRKARRAIAAAAGGLVSSEKPTKKRSKEKGADVDHTVPFKKRCRMITTATSGTAKKKLRLDDLTIRVSKTSTLHRVLPQDERDAAILLMALSCGLIHR